MRPNILEIVSRCVSEGVESGWDEAYDSLEHPTVEQVQETVVQAVMREIHMYFEFEDGEK